MKRLTFLIILTTVLLLAACGGQQFAEPAAEIAEPLEELPSPPLTATALPTGTSSPPPEAPTGAPTSTPVEEKLQEKPTAEPDPTATVEVVVEVEEPAPLHVISGQTAEGAYFYGDPSAPVTLFDYSDFL